MELILDHLQLSFDDKTLLADLSLSISQGDFLVIRGQSGSGKSSFLRLLNRLAEPSSGSIRVDDEPLHEMDVTTYRRRVGYVQQTPIMVDGSVYDNLVLPFGYSSSTSDAPGRDHLASELESYNMKDVDLDEAADTLSVGQKQRVALIRTLLTEPDILLCDEPTSALDPESRHIVEDRIREVNRSRGTTVVLVTHLEFEPGDVETRSFVIQDGDMAEAA